MGSIMLCRVCVFVCVCVLMFSAVVPSPVEPFLMHHHGPDPSLGQIMRGIRIWVPVQCLSTLPDRQSYCHTQLSDKLFTREDCLPSQSR